MILTTLEFTTDLRRGTQMEVLHNAFMVGDQEAHRFVVALVNPDGGGTVSLTGAGVQGFFVRRGEDSTVVINGESDGNKAIVTLPAACYAVPGRFSFIMRVSMGDTVHSVLWCDGVISRSRTDTLIDPGDVVPTLDELLGRISVLEAVTEAASDIVVRDEEAAGSATASAKEAVAAAATATEASTQAQSAATTSQNAALEAMDADQSARAAANRAADSEEEAAVYAKRAEAAADRAESSGGSGGGGGVTMAQVTEEVENKIPKITDNTQTYHLLDASDIDATLAESGKAADAAETGKAIAELTQEIDQLNSTVGSIAGVTEVVSVVFAESNIIHDAMINGYPGSATYGNTANTSGYVCTTMIPLDFDAGKPVSVRCTLSGYAGLGIYDQGGNTLDVITGVNAADYGLVSGQGMKTYTIILPEGAKYVRMSASTGTTDGSPAYTTPSDFVLMGEKTSGLSDKIAALESEINSNVTDIASKKVLVIGDSISADYYGDYPKWVTHLTDIGFFNAGNTMNDSIHATGFVARHNNEANDFITRLAAVSNPETYDMVIVFGGINDYIQSIPLGESGGNKAANFKPAVDDFFATLTETFVGARIAVLTPLRTKSYNTANTAGHKQSDYADYIKTVAKSYALPVLDLMNHSGFHPEHDFFRQRWTFKDWTGGDGTQGDGVHPIEEYERKHLAPMIRHFLQGLL